MINLFGNLSETKSTFIVFNIIDHKSNEVLYVGITNYSVKEAFEKLIEEADNNSHVPICKYIHNVQIDSMKIEEIAWTDNFTQAKELKKLYIQTLHPAYNCEIGMTYIDILH